jgi:rhomboid protease GluP
MSDQPQPGILDRLVDLIAGVMDMIGLNGTRFRWRWHNRKAQIGEAGLKTEIAWRSAKTKHKMCPSCRALVPRGVKSCPECGQGLAGVRAPGVGRLLSNILPGATATTSLLLLVNGLFFMLMLILPPAAGTGGQAGGLARLMSFNTYDLLRLGGGLGSLVMHDGEWWRLVTSIFLHGGLIHFGFNSYVLLQLGPLAEETYGTERFWVIYLWSGIAGNLLAQFLRPGVPVVGASGAIVGLIGLLLAYGIRRGGVIGGNIRSVMTRYAIYILVFSLLPGISLLSHAGGFVGGFLLGLVIPAGALKGRQSALLFQGLALAGVVLVLWSFYQVAMHGGDFLRYLN